MVADLQDALASANLPAVAEDAPRVLTAPAWLLTRVAGGSVRKLRPDRLIELNRPELRIGVYPSDIAISGATRDRTRARAAILSRLAMTSAHLTTSAEAQEVEDQLTLLARPVGSGGSIPRIGRGAAFEAVDARLLELAIPTDEWDILYRLRLQIERDLLAGIVPGTAFPGHVPGPRDRAAPVGSIGTYGGPAPGLARAATLAAAVTPRSLPSVSHNESIGRGVRP